MLKLRGGMHINVNHRKSRIIFSGGLVALACLTYAALPAKSSRKTHALVHSYAAVEIIMKADCVSCHNDARHPEAVNLSTYKKLMKSGEHGPIVIPGHPEKSNLLLYINGQKQPRMPFGRPPLSKHDISLISDWIRAGAHG